MTKTRSIINYREKEDFNIRNPKRKGVRLFFELYFSSFTKLLQVNLLFVLLCLPVVTAPASICGLTHVVLRIARDQVVFVWDDYWEAFRRSFKKALAYGLVYAGLLALIVVGTAVYLRLLDQVVWAVVPLALILSVAIIFVMMNFYIFMLITVKPGIKLRKVLKYSLALVFRGGGHTLLCLGICALLAIPIYWYFPVSLLPVAVIWCATICMVICFNCWKVVEKNILLDTTTGIK